MTTESMDYFAFYWTLPVPWAGFIELPTDADEAAKLSRTIRYQVERVRRWVAEQKGRLIDEQAYLELKPDRGTEEIEPVIDKLIARARKHGARLVLVDFSEAMNWRRHGPLWDRLDASGLVDALDPVPVLIDGKWFKPDAHFRTWRQAERLHVERKEDRRAALIDAIRALREQGLSYPVIAAELNCNGLRTPNGKPWSGANVRKLVVAMPPS
ncbi:recombinase family protein [Cereibacter sphaeroides]|uniref:recombinase family protein n=1 Tax=Cereibacter sphaeroides TaxID=1063 RepID=UPI001F21B2E6|nr:recombinase family protein [Cereibacter sphaeroides]MCE6968055.1 recombinase family protein [Cereibacter sphaeroides]